MKQFFAILFALLVVVITMPALSAEAEDYQPCVGELTQYASPVEADAPAFQMDVVQYVAVAPVRCAGFGGFAFAQDDMPDADPVAQAADDFNILQFLKLNFAELLIALMAFLKVIVRLTPTLKDDAIFGKIDSLVEWFVPNCGGKSKK